MGAVDFLGAQPALASPCTEATISWDGGANTNAWMTAANWTGDRLPGANDHVCIPASAPSATVSNSGSVTIKSVEAQKPFHQAGTLTLTSTTVPSSWIDGSLGGALKGPGEMRVSGAVAWNGGGTLEGSSTLRVIAGGRVDISPQGCCYNRYLGSNSTVVVDGTMTIGGGEGVAFGANFRLENNGRLEWAPTSYSEIEDQSGSGAKPLIVNSGTFVKTTGDNKSIYVPLWNKAGGLVKSDLGQLWLWRGAGENASSGTFGGGIVLYDTHPLAGASFTGIGNTLSGTHTLSAGTTTTIAGGTTTQAATVNGPGKLLVLATLDVIGQFTTGATVEIAPGGRANLMGPSCCSARLIGSNASIVNDGTLFVGGTYGISFGDNFRIQNNTTLEIASGSEGHILDSSSGGAARPLITNAGTITKTVGLNKAIYVPLWNKSGGVVRSDSGELHLHNGTGSNPASGTYAGGIVLYGTHPLSGVTFTGTRNKLAGTHVLAPGTTTTIGPAAGAILAGDLEGPGKLLVRGTLDWHGGQMRKAGYTYVAEQGRLNIPTPGCCYNLFTGSDYSIVNDGTIAVGTGEGLELGADFNIFNNGTLEWNAGYYGDIYGGGLIANSGTFVKTGYDRGIWVPVENDGTIRIETGGMTLYGRFRSFSRTRNILTQGEYELKGALRISELSVVRNAARITLDGPAAALLNQSGGNALRVFSRNAGGGRFTLKNGATLSTVGPIRNAGRVTVEAGSTLTTPGYTQVRGATVVDAATSTLAVGTSPGINVVAGSLRGSGVVQGNVTNSGGVVMPGGASPGQLSIQGSYTQAAGGSLDLDVAGVSTYDSLAVTGAATLGGRLGLSTSPGYTPTVGDAFSLLTYASQTGSFASVAGTGLPGGLSYLLQLQPQSTTAVVQ